MIKKFVPICLLLASLTMPANAMQSNDDRLRDLRAKQNEERILRSEVAYTNRQCGTSIRASINWSRISSWSDIRGIAKACDAALGAVETMCRGEKKSSVQSQIKSFQCSGDSSGPSLSGSTLRFGASPNRNGFSETRSYLDRRL